MKKFIHFLAIGFGEKKGLIASVLLLLPALLTFVVYLFAGHLPIFSFGHTLTIVSIFLGFFLTLLLTINTKITTLGIEHQTDSVKCDYEKRYLLFSERFMSVVVMGIMIMSLLVVDHVLVELKVDCFATRFLFWYFSILFAMFVAMSISILYKFLREDFEKKKDSLWEK